MKYRYFYIIVLLLGFQNALSQSSDTTHHQVDSLEHTTANEYLHHQHHSNNHIRVKYDYDMGSVLNNSFLRKSIYGGSIDKELIDENFARLAHGPNHIGNTVDFAVQYRRFTGQLFGMKDIGFSVAFEWHLHNDFDFTDDLYLLVMNGNKDFAGKTADLSDTKFNYLKYSQIKLGLFKEHPENHSEFGFQLALNLGNQFEEFEAHHAHLNTDVDGKSIELSGDFDYLESGYIGRNDGMVQGYGAGLDLFYEIEKYQHYQFKIDVANIGFIVWNKKSLEYKKEEHLVFEGIEIDNIFDMHDDAMNTNVVDSLHDYIIANGERGAHMTYTPLELDVLYQYYFTNNVSATARFRHKIFGLYSPYYQLGATYHIKEKYHIGADINYGGYTKLNFGMSLCIEISDNFVLNLRSRYISGFYGSKFSGIGGFAQIDYKF